MQMNKTHTTYKAHRHESSTPWLPHNKFTNKQNKHMKNRTTNTSKQKAHPYTTNRHTQNTLWPPHATTKSKPSKISNFWLDHLWSYHNSGVFILKIHPGGAKMRSREISPSGNIYNLIYLHIKTTISPFIHFL